MKKLKTQFNMKNIKKFITNGNILLMFAVVFIGILVSNFPQFIFMPEYVITVQTIPITPETAAMRYNITRENLIPLFLTNIPAFATITVLLIRFYYLFFVNGENDSFFLNSNK